MNLAIHVALFLCIALAIVTVSAFYSEAEDRLAFRSLLKRYWHFLFGCAVLTIVILVCERVFGSVR
jgi:hypothetical protein